MNKNLRVAIHRNEAIYYHSNSWTNPWIEYCKEHKLNFKVVDCYGLNAMEKLKDFDCLLWPFGNYSLQEMLFARSILYSASQMGLKVFPDFNTAWHFDDKIAEYYFLKSVNAVIPESWVFYTQEDCIDWLKDKAKYPIVAKLKSGAGSNNVKMIKNVSQGISYARRMFGRGIRNVPGVFFKAKSNLRSAHSWETILKRYKRIPEFLKTRARALKLPRENGYTYFQEFIPNDGFDLKVAVVGDKLSFLARNVRKGDFRASGGGEIKYEKTYITEEIRKTSFELSDKLGFQCMGYDFVIDKRDNTAKIVEISYGFSHSAQLELGGHWNRTGTWHNEPMNAPVEVLKNILK